MVAELRLLKLKKFSGLLPTQKTQTVYKATILQAFIYPSDPLRSLTLPTKYKFQIAQNKALRFVTKADRYSLYGLCAPQSCFSMFFFCILYSEVKLFVCLLIHPQPNSPHNL